MPSACHATTNSLGAWRNFGLADRETPINAQPASRRLQLEPFHDGEAGGTLSWLITRCEPSRQRAAGCSVHKNHGREDVGFSPISILLSAAIVFDCKDENADHASVAITLWLWPIVELPKISKTCASRLCAAAKSSICVSALKLRFASSASDRAAAL
jgi:hypothetical protein